MRDEIIFEKLKDIGLEHHFEAFKPLIRDAVTLNLTQANEEDIPVGASKIGGKPDLPPHIEFPTQGTDKTPLTFLGQINLAEIAHFQLQDNLPKTGLLYFFYSQDMDHWGFEEQDKDAFKVIYYDGDLKSLTRREFPLNLDKDYIYHACSVEFIEKFDLPEELPDFLSENEEEKDVYFNLRRDYDLSILGYSDPVQGNVEYNFELNEKFILPYNSQAHSWRLLMQFPSNDESGMNFVDNGTVYFGIREDKLKQRDFDHCWFCLQTY